MPEMMSDALTNAGKRITSNIESAPAVHKRFNLLIGPNDGCYDVTLFPAFCWRIGPHLKRSVDTFIMYIILK